MKRINGKEYYTVPEAARLRCLPYDNASLGNPATSEKRRRNCDKKSRSRNLAQPAYEAQLHSR